MPLYQRHHRALVAHHTHGVGLSVKNKLVLVASLNLPWGICELLALAWLLSR